MFGTSNDFSGKTTTALAQTFHHHSKKPTWPQRRQAKQVRMMVILKPFLEFWKVLIPLRLGSVWTKTAKFLPLQNALHLTPPDPYQEKKNPTPEASSHFATSHPYIPPHHRKVGRIIWGSNFLLNFYFSTLLKGEKLETPYIKKALNTFKIPSRMRNTSHQTNIPTLKKKS